MNVGDLVGRHAQVSSVLTCDELPFKARVGVEVELEDVSASSRAISLNYWNAVDDGSLRDGGIEFIFKEPLGGLDAVAAVDELCEKFKRRRHSCGVRTSLHVHVDVRDMTREQLQRFVLLYVCFEEALTGYCGPARRDSTFAVLVEDSQELLARYGRIMMERELTRSNRGRRYGALNTESISVRGSVEFRSHPGTLDRDKILRWINILLSMRQCAVESECDEPMEIAYQLYHLGYRKGLAAVFGEYAKHLNITLEQYEAALLRAKTICSYRQLALYHPAMGDNEQITALDKVRANMGVETPPDEYEDDDPDYDEDDEDPSPEW